MNGWSEGDCVAAQVIEFYYNGDDGEGGKWVWLISSINISARNADSIK